MADAENVTQLPRALPDEVVLRAEELATPRFTPRELRLIQEHLGRSFSQLVTDEASDDKLAVVAWLKLRRDGYDVSWDEMDDVVISIAAESANPTSAQPGTTSPPSASTTG